MGYELKSLNIEYLEEKRKVADLESIVSEISSERDQKVVEIMCLSDEMAQMKEQLDQMEKDRVKREESHKLVLKNNEEEVNNLNTCQDKLMDEMKEKEKEISFLSSKM